MQVTELGNPEGPLVVCVHGLMGHGDDYRPYAELWGKEFRLLIPNLSGDRSTDTGYGVEVDGEKRLIYEFSADQIAEYLREVEPGEKPFFVGISYGGKIIMEMAGKNPDLVGAASITDVGPGPLCKESGLFKFIYETIPSINFDQPWKSLRQDLKAQIPDRMLRILIQAHITYPYKDAPKGSWKGHAYDFHNLLRNSSLEDQWRFVDTIEAKIRIFKATVESAIDDRDFEKMRDFDCFEFHEIAGANHFIQINNFEEFRDGSYQLMREFYRDALVG